MAAEPMAFDEDDEILLKPNGRGNYDRYDHREILAEKLVGKGKDDGEMLDGGEVWDGVMDDSIMSSKARP